MPAETEEQRRKREQQRLLFDGVAGLYDTTRLSHPAEIVSTIFTTAVIGPGAVLEIGCGTGQFTRHLAGPALDVAAIDIGAAMVAAARRNVADPRARFQVCSLGDVTGRGSFDLIVSATAFQLDRPAIGQSFPAAAARRLAGAAGHRERYPEPFRTQLRDLWIWHSHQNAPWADRQPG